MPDVPANLVESLVAWIDEQAVVVGWFPGGTFNTAAPEGAVSVLPYLTFGQSGGRVTRLVTAGVSPVTLEWPDITIEVRADNARDARRLAGSVRKLLLPAVTPLSWAGGREIGRFQGDGEGGELEEGLGPGGTDVWVHRLAVTFNTIED